MSKLESLFIVETEEVKFDEKSSLEELIAAKKVLETNLGVLFDHLKLHKSDMDTDLLTPDGYPRADIDVLQVRMARAKINVYRNDLKQVLQLIEKHLTERLAVGVPNMERLELEDEANDEINDIDMTQEQVPFAFVSEVTEESPALTAGMIVNDQIISIGPINASNHENLKRLPGFILANEDVSKLRLFQGEVRSY